MKTRNYKLLIAMILFAISPFGLVKGQTLCGNFDALQTAFTKINNGTLNGDVVIRLTANIAMASTLTLNASGTGGANYSSVTITTSASGKTITGNFNGAFFIFDGADNVTIDGSASPTILKITQSNTGSSACIAEFKNGACNNYIKYCNLTTVAGYTGDGLIKFTTTNSTTSNDNNTIQNCTMSNLGSGKPIVYSFGTSSYPNKGNKIATNTIDKYIKVGANSKAIAILDNSDQWDITGNSFFESASLTGGNFDYYAIYISNLGGKYNISNNYFGGKSALCGGTAFSITGNSTSKWTGIYMNVTTSGSASDIYSNNFKNINITSGNATPFYAIYIDEGKVKLSSTGTGSENYIGSTSASDAANGISITNTTCNASSYGIYNKSSVATEIYETQIGNITTIGSASYSHNFTGIYKTGTGTTTINRNYIGSSTISNSINASSSATSGDQSVYGIYCNGSGNTTITSNTISNINNNYANTTATAGQVVGIFVNDGINTIQSNKILNLSTTSPSDGKTTTSASIIGISMSSISEGQVISSNTISGLTNNNSTASRSVGVFGICYAGATSGTNKIEGNFIHSFDITTDEPTAELSGIRIESGTSTYSNNIISLGVNTTAGCFIHGIFENGEIGNNNNIYSNTIYLAGTPSGSSSNTYCLFNNTNNNTRNIRNNLLFNARDGGTGASHYAIKIEGTTNLTIDYNDYFTTGSGGILAYINGSDANNLTSIQTATGQDGNSINTNPLFNTEGGTVSYNYYPLATTIDGIAILGIESDFDLGIRNSPPTIGALEGINKWIGIEDNIFENANNWTLKSTPLSGEDLRFHAFPYNNCVLSSNKVIGFYENNQNVNYLDLNGYTLTIQKDIKTSNGGFIDATSVSGSKLIFNGSSIQSISSGAFLNNQLNDLELDNSTGVVLNGGSLNISGTYTKTNGLLDVKTNLTTITFNGATGAQTIPANIFSNNNTVYSLTIDNTDNVILTGNIKVSGILTANNGYLDAVTNTTSLEFVGIEGQQNIPASFFTDNKATNIKISNIDGISLGGELIIENELFFNTGSLYLNGFTLTLNGTIDNTYPNGLFGSDASNLIIGGTADKSIQFNQDDIANYSILDITSDCSGNVAFGSDNLINIVGSLTQTTGSITATNNNRISFSGASGQQTIPVNFFTDNKISGLEINNPDGLLLAGDLQIQTEILFSQGNLDAATYSIILEDNIAVTCDGTTGYIIGKCTKIGDDAFTFPVGGATYYGPVTITAPSVDTDIFSVTCYELDPATQIGDSLEFNVDELCNQRYWDITRELGLSNVKISLPWCTYTHSILSSENLDRASVMHWNGTKWEYVPSLYTGDIDAGSTTSSESVSSFSPFTFGTRKTSLLPVEFVKMEMSCENDKPVLNWQTASETNNDYFEIQSSNDSKTWSKVATIKGAGNSNQLINYSFSDVVNGLYYRIKQVDFNQKTAYSQPITSYCNPQLTNDNVAIYPNPTTGNISINITNNRINCRYSILNGIGKTVMTGNLSELSNAIDLTNLSNGIYFIKIDGFEKIEKISKQ